MLKCVSKSLVVLIASINNPHQARSVLETGALIAYILITSELQLRTAHVSRQHRNTYKIDCARQKLCKVR
jgi:hypothetical protein